MKAIKHLARIKDGTVEEILAQMVLLFGDWSINYWDYHDDQNKVSVSGRRNGMDQYGWFGSGKTVAEALHDSVNQINGYLEKCEQEDIRRKERDTKIEFNERTLI